MYSREVWILFCGMSALTLAAALGGGLLWGIGPALAGRIIAYREEHGPFTEVEELLEVSGIGEVVLDGLRDQIVLEDTIG